MQIGQGRGGFYSYELLENMIGCRMKNANEIMPDLQHLEVGDSIVMHPTMGSPYKVAAIEPERTLVLLLRVDMQTGNTFEFTGKIPDKYQNSSWVFFLDEGKDGTTRPVSRSRNDWTDSLGNTLFFGIFGNFTLEMDRKMMLRIKGRTEAAKKHTRDTPWDLGYSPTKRGK